MGPPKVYIDTNVLKFSATQLPRLIPSQTTIIWGGRIHDVMVHDFDEVNPNETITNQDLKKEAQLLPELAVLGKSGKVRYVIQMETLLESWGIPNMDSSSGRFYGSPYEPVDAPIQYGRVVFSGGGNTQKMQFEFLCGIRSQSFFELQKMTGAYQGEGKINRNQLLDAFHLWCAEHNECDYFLTLDFKLIKVLQQNQKIKLKIRPVCPSELLREVQEST
jgi:hypothetical protein